MLEWWGVDGNTADIHDEELETPAHVFAAKAFRTALFGTPAPSPDTDIKPRRLNMLKDTGKTATASPAKGILLTPGTALTRRKTVSFDAQDQVETQETEEKTGDNEQSMDESRDIVESIDSARPVRRNLFNRPRSFDAKRSTIFTNKPEERSSSTQPLATKESQKQRASTSNSEAKVQVLEDFTVDLEQPRSASGQHWMREYQRDHALSKAEMKKLIKYTQNAKSDVARTDKLVADLRVQLTQSESRVQQLEKQLAESKCQQCSATTLPDMQGKDMGSNKDGIALNLPELRSLQLAAKQATDRAAKLEQENENFRGTILRIKNEMTRYENQHISWMEQRKRKDERHLAQRQILKNKIVMYRTKLQAEFDTYKAQAEEEKAILIDELDAMRGAATSNRSHKRGPQNSNVDPLRQLLVRVHERSSRKQIANHGNKLNTHTNAAFERLRSEWQVEDDHPESSPTILESHIKRAARSTIGPVTFQRFNSRGLAQGRHHNVGRSKLKHASPAKRHNVSAVDADENYVPVQSDGNEKVAARPTREIRIKSRHALARRLSATSGRTGLTPVREAAARLRIAQRSAQKQRSTKSQSGEDDADGGDAGDGDKNNDNSKASDSDTDWLVTSPIATKRDVLAERTVNRP